MKLFDGEPLGIFASKIFAAEYQNSLNLWYSLEKHELDLAISQPPANYFEKMILWTEQGKIWHFPIDNEQGRLNVNHLSPAQMVGNSILKKNSRIG